MNEPTTLQRLMPVLIGVAITGLFLVGLGYLANARRNAESVTPPTIVVLAPGDGAAVDSPLVVRFTTQAPVELGPSGWGTAHLHLHARIGNVEHMPAAEDITRSADTLIWTFSTVPRGAHTLKLGWADLSHREIATGASAPISITIR